MVEGTPAASNRDIAIYAYPITYYRKRMSIFSHLRATPALTYCPYLSYLAASFAMFVVRPGYLASL